MFLKIVKVRFINETRLIQLMLNMTIAQVLLMLVIGLWLGARFKESPVIKFFGRNDWFVGAFLVIVGYMNYTVYTAVYAKNLNIVLIAVGLMLIVISLTDLIKR